MITPELKQYISQMRAKGASDAQIRSGLVSAGWSSSDLDEAFVAQSQTSSFVGPSSQPYNSPQLSQTSQTKSFPRWVIWLIVFLVILPLLFWGLIWGAGMFGLYKLSRIIPDSFLGYNTSPTQNDSLKLCGEWPGNDSNAKQNFIKGAVTRTGIADGFPIYPASISIGKMVSADAELMGEDDMCSPDESQQVVDFYLGEGSRQGWTFKTGGAPGLGFDDPNASGGGILPKGALLFGEPDSRNGSYVMLNIFRDYDHTVIRIHYYNNPASKGSAMSNSPGVYNGTTFSMPIPNGWKVASPKLEGFDFAMSAPKEQGFSANITVAKSQVADTVTPESVAKSTKAMEEKEYPDYKIIVDTPITIDYRSAYQITFSWHDPRYDLDITSAQIFVKDKNTMYTITATSLASLYANYKPTFQSSVNGFYFPL